MTSLQIWVDADACPRVIKEILFRASEKRGIPMTLVANKPMPTPPRSQIRSLQVPGGLDEADGKIVELLREGDLVVTADIPLAARVIDKGGFALDPRGEFFTSDNIGERLAIRNLLDELRGAGVETGGPPAFNPGDRMAFANQLDRFLTRRGK